MNKASGWNAGSMFCKIMMLCVLTGVAGGIDATPAFSKDRDKYDNGRYEQRGPGYDRGRHHNRGRRRVYTSYGYREQVYVSPPVVYAPPPPPGISFFLPPIVIRP